MTAACHACARALIAAAALAVMLSGCVRAAAPIPTPSGPRPQSTATLSIVQPVPAVTVISTQMHIELKLVGGRIVQETSKNLTPDEGHVHVTIDGHLLSMNYTLEDDVSLQGFPPGPHVFQAEFVAKDHAPFDPRVIARVLFEYEPRTP